MCDHDSIRDMIELEQRRARELTRRRFGALATGTGVATMLLPGAASGAAAALEVVESEVEVRTPDGTADAHFAHPRSGAHAGVLVWTDIMGLRPAFREMGKRLASSGYAVLTPNPFYRTQKGAALPPGANLRDEATRSAAMKLAGTLNAQTHASDARAFVAFLDAQRVVDRKRRIGTTGYCMGGPIVMRTAAALPQRIGAGASFHGGGLATDKPDSPHLLIPQMKASFLIAIAENDDRREPEVKNVLRDAFAKAKRPAEIEVYAGAQHGWCPPDSMVYDEAQAERAWSRLLALFGKALA